MRPVEKWEVGSKHKIIDPKDFNQEAQVEVTIQVDYDPYKEAKRPLIGNLGKYCSYCELYISLRDDLDVEHVQPKKLYPDLETKWDNFLVACFRCNRIEKGEKDVTLTDVALPHRDNTFYLIEYLDGGLVSPNPNATIQQQKMAEALIQLVGLDKYPGNESYPKEKIYQDDERWAERREAWEKAEKYFGYYRAGAVALDNIIDQAKSGFWSVWMTWFKDYPEVKNALIQALPGTAMDCFDAEGNPIPRPH